MKPSESVFKVIFCQNNNVINQNTIQNLQIAEDETIDI